MSNILLSSSLVYVYLLPLVGLMVAFVWPGSNPPAQARTAGRQPQPGRTGPEG
jgi:hypothetical protein